MALIVESNRRLLRRKKEDLIKVIQTQETERQRIGKDLHDSLSPLISTIRRSAGRIELDCEERGVNLSDQFLQLDDLLEQGGIIIRETSHNLKPSQLDLGLIPALDDFVGMTTSESQSITFYTRGKERKLPDHADILLYRIILELVQNAIKHSISTRIGVYLFWENTLKLHIIVYDNGAGFDRNSIKTGMGLSNIESRVQVLAGKIDYLKPKRGNRIHLSFNINKWK